MPITDFKYQPFYRIDGGPSPRPIGWSDMSTVAHPETRWNSIPVEKIDFDDGIDLGLATLFGIKWDEQQIKRVAKKGAPYVKIQDAIDSIGDNSATKHYVIEIGDGIYVEELTMKPYVHFVGKGHEHTTIKNTSLTNGLINIDTSANSSIIQMTGINYEITEHHKSFILSTAIGLDLYVADCRFYNSSTAGTVETYVWNGAVSSASTVHFNGCIYEGTGASNFVTILADQPSGDYSDTHYIKNCILKFALLGDIGNATSSATLYVNNCDQESTIAGPQCVVYAGSTVYVEGGRWGNPNSNQVVFDVAGGEVRLVGCHIFGNQTNSLLRILNAGGTFYVNGCEVSGGESAIELSSGTANLRNTSFAKHASGAGYDINNSGGTCNVTFCKYTTSNGTITKVDENVDKVDGFHANQTPTANTIPVREAGSTDIAMGSGNLTGARSPVASGEPIIQTAKITETILEDSYDSDQDFTARTGFPGQGLTTTTLSFVDGTLTFTIASVGATFDYYIKGVKYTVTTSDSVAITDTEGKWYIYYDGATLTANQSQPSTFWTGGVQPVSILYWKADVTKAHLHIHRETHFIDARTHPELHYTVGSTYRTGLDISGYTLNTDSNVAVTFGISNGIIYDEDMPISIAHSATPSADFQQILSDPGQIPVYYLEGATPNLRKDVATDYAFKNTTAGRINWNELTGGSYQQTQCTDNYFVPYLVCGRNTVRDPVFAVQGIAQYSKLADAINAGFSAFNLSSLAVEELKPLYITIYRSKGTFGGTRKAKLVYVGDVRQATAGAGTSITATSHNALSDRDAVGSHPASAIAPDTTNFDGALTSADDDIQKVAETLDDAIPAHGNSPVPINPYASTAIGAGTWLMDINAIYYLHGTWYNSTTADLDNITYGGIFLSKATYTLRILTRRNTDRGIMDIDIDGVEVASFDLYGSLDSNRSYVQGSISVATAGLKDIRFRVHGKNGSSSDYLIGFTMASFTRTA